MSHLPREGRAWLLDRLGDGIVIRDEHFETFEDPAGLRGLRPRVADQYVGAPADPLEPLQESSVERKSKRAFWRVERSERPVAALVLPSPDPLELLARSFPSVELP